MNTATAITANANTDTDQLVTDIVTKLVNPLNLVNPFILDFASGPRKLLDLLNQRFVTDTLYCQTHCEKKLELVSDSCLFRSSNSFLNLLCCFALNVMFLTFWLFCSDINLFICLMPWMCHAYLFNCWIKRMLFIFVHYYCNYFIKKQQKSKLNPVNKIQITYFVSRQEEDHLKTLKSWQLWFDIMAIHNETPVLNVCMRPVN